MDKSQKKKMIAVIITLVISVISLGVAFAAFSGTLYINGTATVEVSKWDMYFTTSSDGTKPSTDTAIPAANIGISNSQTGVDPTVTATGSMVATTLTWDAIFRTPGDTVTYTVYVKNDGSYNAKVTNVNLPMQTCTVKTGTPEQEQETAICAHIHYGLYNNSDGTNPVAVDQTIPAGTTKTYYLIAWLDTNFAQDGSDLPTETVKTNQISATVSFGQN